MSTLTQVKQVIRRSYYYPSTLQDTISTILTQRAVAASPQPSKPSETQIQGYEKLTETYNIATIELRLKYDADCQTQFADVLTYNEDTRRYEPLNNRLGTAEQYNAARIQAKESAPYFDLWLTDYFSKQPTEYDVYKLTELFVTAWTSGWRPVFAVAKTRKPKAAKKQVTPLAKTIK